MSPGPNNNDDDIFDDSFEDLDNDGGFDQPRRTGNANGGGSLLDLWNNNPMVKLAVIAGLVVIAVGSVYAFVGGNSNNKDAPSQVGLAPGQREAPGGNVSESYGDALEEQNQQKLEQALGDRGVSAIPVPVNRGDDSLVLQGDQDVSTEDPLATWQRENAPAPEPVQPVSADPTGAIPPAAPVQPAPEQVQALSEAINGQIQSILASRVVKPGQYVSYNLGSGGTGNLQSKDPTPNSGPVLPIHGGGTMNADGTVNSGVQEILVPAGTILYAQILNEANSDTPGPIVAQLLSGPLVGSRVIGEFDEKNEKIIISFNTAVVKGIGNQMNGVAIDPSTTSPGLATDTDHRYFRRVILPAAARFVEGLGEAYSRQETEVFTSGDVIVQKQNKVRAKESFAEGVEEGASKVGDILEDEGDKLRPLIRVEAGTPIGIILVDPIMKPNQNVAYRPPGSAPAQ